MRLVIIGQGHVGLPMAMRAVETGLEVVGLEQDQAKVGQLNAGRSHVSDVTDAALARALAAGYRATGDPSVIEAADVVLVCVPTPLATDHGGPDLGAVEAAAHDIARHVSAGTLVVLESTTYPGTTSEVFGPIVAGDRLTIGDDLFVAFSPERIDPGNRTWGVRNTPKVVGGLTPACTKTAVAFYEQLVDTVIVAKGALEAEMSKLVENTFRHVNLALVNEMVRFCHELGIDLWDAIDCAETKPFGFMSFRPGPGVGGHCIPVDPSYLSHRVQSQLGYPFRMVEVAEEINTAAPYYVAERARELLRGRRPQGVDGARILLLGVTYKPDVGDRRHSPAEPLAQRLASWGAELTYHDPFVPRWQPTDSLPELWCEADPVTAAGAADLVVLLQPHASYDLAAIAAAAACLLDTRGAGPRGTTVRL